MFLKHLPVAALCCSVLLAGCPNPDDPQPTPSPSPDAITQSLRNNVKFKRAQRIRNDFAQVLEIDPATVCNELGLYSCTDFVHKVALGGVSPYDVGINDPPALTGATAPIVVDRVALAACVQRVDADIASGTGAVIFDLSIDGNGALTDVGTVDPVIADLYQRAMLRAPTSDEFDTIRGFYTTVAATSDTPARDWALLTCFSVLTTMESLFY